MSNIIKFDQNQDTKSVVFEQCQLSYYLYPAMRDKKSMFEMAKENMIYPEFPIDIFKDEQINQFEHTILEFVPIDEIEKEYFAKFCYDNPLFESKEKTGLPKKCDCDIYTIFNFGCKCGGV